MRPLVALPLGGPVNHLFFFVRRNRQGTRRCRTSMLHLKMVGHAIQPNGISAQHAIHGSVGARISCRAARHCTVPHIRGLQCTICDDDGHQPTLCIAQQFRGAIMATTITTNIACTLSKEDVPTNVCPHGMQGYIFVTYLWACN